MENRDFVTEKKNRERPRLALGWIHRTNARSKPLSPRALCRQKSTQRNLSMCTRHNARFSWVPPSHLSKCVQHVVRLVQSLPLGVLVHAVASSSAHSASPDLSRRQKALPS